MANYHGLARAEGASSSADEYPLRDNIYSDSSPMPSPGLPAFYSDGSPSLSLQNTRDDFTLGDKYSGYGGSDSVLHLPKEREGYTSPLRNSASSRQKGIAGWSLRKKILIGGGSILAVIAIAAVLGGVFANKKNSSSSSSDGSSNSDTSSSTAPTNDQDAQKKGEGAKGTTITFDDGTTFLYNNSFGGHWVSRPYDDSARPRSDVPALNQEWDWSNDKINGVNLGGWLVIEPFITPALFEQYNNQVIDEYDLHVALGSNLSAAIEDHYNTFITERDFAEIACAGLNWIRLPVPFWFIETYPGEPFLEGVGWKYFVKGLNWARKYGLRVQVDFHAVPGSQNGLNHSGKFGTVGFLNGVMGISNAQRTLNYIRTIVEFISQPQYKNVAASFMPVNEPYQEFAIGQQPMQAFYREVYETVRGITGYGKGNGPMIVMHDGFSGTNTWDGYMKGADRLALESHHYLAFTADSFADSYQSLVTRPCQWWAQQYNATFNNFGFAEAGEWCLATNDCGQYVNGVGLGAHYDGSYNTTANATEHSFGDCTAFSDASTFSADFKTQLKQMTMAYWDATHNWLFWTWKCAPNSSGKIPNPLWSYQLGLQEGYIPDDPRPKNYLGACDALASSLNLPGKTNVQWNPPLQDYMVGEAAAYSIDASVTSNYSAWPPAALTGIPTASNLPVLTATGTPITLSPATQPTGVFATGNATNVGNGWANPSDTASYYTTIAGCDYLDAYSGVGAAVATPTEPCTGAAAAAAKRSIRTAAPRAWKARFLNG